MCLCRKEDIKLDIHRKKKPQNVNIISINSWNGLPNGCMGNNLQHHSHKASNNNSTAEQHCSNNNQLLCFIYEHFPQEFFAVEFSIFFVVFCVHPSSVIHNDDIIFLLFIIFSFSFFSWYRGMMIWNWINLIGLRQCL